MLCQMNNWFVFVLSNTNDIKIDSLSVMPSNYGSWIDHSASWTDNDDNPVFGFNVNSTMSPPYSLKIVSYLQYPCHTV